MSRVTQDRVNLLELESTAPSLRGARPILPNAEVASMRAYSFPLPALRTGALYNAFSYPTKISPETIGLLIASHTQPGATILDVFGGSGTTGLAALLCDRPTPLMQKMASEMELPVTWGPRNAIVQDLSVLGSFVSNTMCNPPEPTDFLRAADALLDKVEAELGNPYGSVDVRGGHGSIRHTIWSEVLTCPGCGREATYWDSAVCTTPLRIADVFNCKSCDASLPMSDVPRVCEVVFDPLLKTTITRRRRVPAYVFGKTAGKNWKRPADKSDLEDDMGRLSSMRHPGPVVPIQWGELHRSGYHTGITHLHHFYTSRNFEVMSAIWAAVEQSDASVRDAMRLLALSYNASHSTLMTRVVIKGGNDFVVTGNQSGVLYVSALPVEKNLFLGMKRKARDLQAAFALVHGSQGTVRVVNASSTSVPAADKSVDYVFTDPPFGDYIPYAEVNQINEGWLGRLTAQRDEITVSPSQNRTVDDYGALLGQVFVEVCRVMKDDAKATVVFHSAKAQVWRALASAFEEACLQVEAAGVLDKQQSSFKQVVSKVSVKGDPLILLSKARMEQNQNGLSEQDLLKDVLDWGSISANRAVTREMLYSRFIARCMAAGISIQTDAATFYSKVALQGVR